MIGDECHIVLTGSLLWVTNVIFDGVSLKHDGTDGPVKSVNTDGTAIERADGTANTGANYQIITY